MKPFHKMTHREAVEYLRSLYYAQPKADWDTLAVGNIIVSKGRGWRITHIPPKRGFVLATNVMTGEAEKLLRSKSTQRPSRNRRGHAHSLADQPSRGNREGHCQGHQHQPESPIRLSRNFHAVP